MINDVGLTGLCTVGIVLRLFSHTLVPLLTFDDAVVAVALALTAAGLLTGGKLFLGNMLKMSASGSLMRVEIKL